MARPKIPTSWTSPTDIKIDRLNPRLPPQDTEQEAIKTLTQRQGTKVIELCKDINKDGLSAAERFMVIKADGGEETYISIDGNRRLLALKLLIDPSLAEGVLSVGQVATLRQEAQAYAEDPIHEVEIAIYPSRMDGAPWVARRHSKNMKGRGQETWGAEEGSHFDAWRNDNKGRPDLQILQFVRNHGNLTAAETKQLARFPITTLRRVITNDHAKKVFGYKIVKGEVITSAQSDEFFEQKSRLVVAFGWEDQSHHLSCHRLTA